MIKSVLPASALLLCSAFAFAAGGGAGVSAGGAAGAATGSHASSTSHGASGNTAIENNTFPGPRPLSGCLGAVAGVPFAGAPWPRAPQSRTNPSATNGLAAGETNPDIPRMTREDQRIIDEIKQANERLGTVGNPATGRTENRQTNRPGEVTRTNEDIQRRNTDRSRPLTVSAPSDSSAAGERTDPRSVESKPNVSQMSEDSQRLAREVIRDTDKLGKVGNPGAGGANQAQQGSLAGAASDRPSDVNGPHLPTSTVGASRGAC
jgi:hypothetical protein